MHIAGHLPGRTLADLAVLHDLGQRHKTQLRIAGGSELVGLGDVLAHHHLGLHLCAQAELVQHFHGSCSVRSQLGVGDRDMLVVAALEHIALVVHIAGLGAPQHQRTDGIGKARIGHALAFLGQLLGCGVIGGQQNAEGRAVVDLGVELAGGAKRQLGLVAGILLELGRNLLHGCGEVGCHGDRHFSGLRLRRPQAQHDCADHGRRASQLKGKTGGAGSDLSH
ncbi:hypothetical protein SDC9_160348 [bioreactor metagenome]|uniref:NAD-specific glutamate dehydrogenase n=1 Tax=bioreactor metagenome TaxID=1076179 RepID=A0A645FF52_9ZZZZ